MEFGDPSTSSGNFGGKLRRPIVTSGEIPLWKFQLCRCWRLGPSAGRVKFADIQHRPVAVLFLVCRHSSHLLQAAQRVPMLLVIILRDSHGSFIGLT